MNSQYAIEILERRREEIEKLDRSSYSSPVFEKWNRDTEIAIEKIFGKKSRHTRDYKNINYFSLVFTSRTTESQHREAYLKGLGRAEAILTSMIDEIKEYGFDNNDNPIAPNQLTIIELLCLRFHAVARQLQFRHASRSTINIDDEYDVQDLFHALLRLHFDDVRAEEWTPSYAGGSARMDFLLKEERIVVEIKKTRAGLKDTKLGEELIIDRARYEAHPNCDMLVCFVYDPEGKIGNPTGVARDLETHSGSLKMRVIIAPTS